MLAGPPWIMQAMRGCLWPVSAQVLHGQIVQFTDAGAAAGNAVVTFETMSLLAPRGRFDVEMHLSSLKLTGQVHTSASPHHVSLSRP